MVDQDLGLSGALKVAHLAEIYGLKIVPHLATEILAHLIAAVPNGLTVEYYPWAMPLFREIAPVEMACLYCRIGLVWAWNSMRTRSVTTPYVEASREVLRAPRPVEAGALTSWRL